MESFEQLAHQYQPMIHKIIRSLNIYKNVDEFYQIGLIALWDAQKCFNEEKGSFTSFAYTSIKGRILNEMAKDKTYAARTVCPEEEYWEMAADPHGDLSFEEEFLHLRPKLNRKRNQMAHQGLLHRIISKRNCRK